MLLTERLSLNSLFRRAKQFYQWRFASEWVRREIIAGDSDDDDDVDAADVDNKFGEKWRPLTSQGLPACLSLPILYLFPSNFRVTSCFLVLFFVLASHLSILLPMEREGERWWGVYIKWSRRLLPLVGQSRLKWNPLRSELSWAESETIFDDDDVCSFFVFDVEEGEQERGTEQAERDKQGKKQAKPGRRFLFIFYAGWRKKYKKSRNVREIPDDQR